MNHPELDGIILEYGNYAATNPRIHRQMRKALLNWCRSEVVKELKNLPRTGLIGQNGIRQDWTPYQIVQERLAQLNSLQKEGEK